MSEQRQNGLGTDGTIQRGFRGDSEGIQRVHWEKVETFDDNFPVEISSF